MPLRRGGDTAEQIQKAKSKRGPKLDYLSSYLKDDGDSVVIRLLDDDPEWIPVDTHEFIDTRPKPKDWEGNWRETMGAVCRKDVGFKTEDGSAWEEGYDGSCYICEHDYGTDRWGRPKSRPVTTLWARACLRTQVRDDNGNPMGYRDQYREIEENGQTKQIRALVVVNFKYGNFFEELHGIRNAYRADDPNYDLRNQDFRITRKNDPKVEYNSYPLPPIADHKPGTESWKVYEEAIEEQDLDLEKLIKYRSSAEYYAMYFDPTQPMPERRRKGKGDTTEQPRSGAQEFSDEALAAMKADMKANMISRGVATS